ncbi:MAG: hypothetical protein ACRD6N_07925, partial [Pyrinomonadaceae bacterium]
VVTLALQSYAFLMSFLVLDVQRLKQPWTKIGQRFQRLFTFEFSHSYSLGGISRAKFRPHTSRPTSANISTAIFFLRNLSKLTVYDTNQPATLSS